MTVKRWHQTSDGVNDDSDSGDDSQVTIPEVQK
jgi:hypothetical protein